MLIKIKIQTSTRGLFTREVAGAFSNGVFFGVTAGGSYVLVKFDSDACVGSHVVKYADEVSDGEFLVRRKRQEVIAVEILPVSTAKHEAAVEVPPELGGWKFGSKCFRTLTIIDAEVNC